MSTTATMKHKGEAAGHEVARWVVPVARLGYAAKGLVYGLVGILAFRLAIGAGGELAGTREAVREIGQQSWGTIVLALVALGLVGYAVWRFIEASVDVEGAGSDGKGIVKRIGYAVSGVIYGSLAIYAATIAFGGSGGGAGGGSGTRQGMTAELLASGWGRWVIGLVGLIVIGVGLRQLYLAYEAKFLRKWNTAEMSPPERKWGTLAGRVGLAARAVVFGIIGGFFIQAALQADSSETRGLAGALAAIMAQPYGAWLLAIVAAGLVAYGVYCFTHARYRHFQVR
jgi:hypothetical protein